MQRRIIELCPKKDVHWKPPQHKVQGMLRTYVWDRDTQSMRRGQTGQLDDALQSTQDLLRRGFIREVKPEAPLETKPARAPDTPPVTDTKTPKRKRGRRRKRVLTPVAGDDWAARTLREAGKR